MSVYRPYYNWGGNVAEWLLSTGLIIWWYPDSRIPPCYSLNLFLVVPSSNPQLVGIFKLCLFTICLYWPWTGPIVGECLIDVMILLLLLLLLLLCRLKVHCLRSKLRVLLQICFLYTYYEIDIEETTNILYPTGLFLGKWKQ